MNILISRLNKFLPTIVNLILLLFVIIEATSGIFDTDIWLHLRTGKLILSNLHVPTIDPYSFTLGAKHWVNHSWLFQVIVYSAYNFYSSSGLIFLQSLFVTMAFFIIFVIGFRKERFLITSLILSVLLVYACRSRFNLRPDILSLIFFALFLHNLKVFKGSKAIYFLILWQVLWVNCHGYFFLGPVLVLIHILAEAIKRYVKILPRSWADIDRMDDASYNRLLKVFILILLATLVNPQFLRGALYPFYVLKGIAGGNSSLAFKYVEELSRTFTLKGPGFVGSTQLYILTVIAALSLAIDWRKLDITCVLLFVVFVPFGFFALRNVAFLGFVAYVIIISRLESFEDMAKAKFKIAVRSANFDLIVKTAIITSIIYFLYAEAYSYLFRRYYDFDEYEMKSALSDILVYRYPKKCVDFIVKNNLPLNLLNDFNSGNYLIFYAWPKYKVFIDGRTELYPNSFLEKYFNIMKGDKNSFDAQVEKYNINTVLLNNATANIPNNLFKMLYEHPKWQLVFFDSSGVVFLKKTPRNEALLARFNVNLKLWRAPMVDMKRFALTNISPEPYLNRARLLDVLEFDDAVISEVNQALKIQPYSSMAQFYLGKIYFKQNKYTEALVHLRISYIHGYKKKDIKLMLAKIYLKFGDKERAKKFYDELIKENPKDKEIKAITSNIPGSVSKNKGK